ncbi:FUSC family protein [Vibrio sp. FNV 38]|nr:FUSC family protein [Vibrio sp. FNV 38]
MFSRSTQEAIKVALTLSLSIGLAIFFQWEKPYWAGIAVIVLALNETFGHSMQKGRNRILGTLLGITVGITLVSLFSQDRFIFLSLITLYLGICMVFYNHAQYGYAIKISVPVCFIISSLGGFDSVTTFNLMVIRTQETLLGVGVFSIVYRFLWPHSTEEVFFANFKELKIKLIKMDNNSGQNNLSDSLEELNICKQQAKKLHEVLSLPLTHSHTLQHEHALWKQRVMILIVFIDYRLALIQQGKAKSSESLGLENIINQTDPTKLDATSAYYFSLIESRFHTIEKHVYEQYKEFTFSKTNLVRSLKGMSMFVSGLLIWIYLPVPMGSIFPMVMGIFACMLPSLPDAMMKHSFYAVIGFGFIFTAEYVLLMPTLTEIWQLCGLYFINIFLLWKIFSSPKYGIYRMLGGNLMLVMTMGALHLTPEYSIDASISMFVCVMLALLIARFFTDLYKPLLR